MNEMNHYHRVYAKIDLDALEHNVKIVRGKISASSKLMAVIKADAYGHGAVGLAKFLQDKVDYFSVAILEEALELRKSGITLPILILDYTSPTQYPILIDADVTQTIFTEEDAIKLSAQAVKLNKTAKIHIAIDTGMSRIGFDLSQKSVEIVERIARLPNIFVEGIFSHYATADCADKSFAAVQSGRYKDFVARLEERGINIPIKHMCNSAAIIEFDDYFDMVRLGISLYGMYPSKDVNQNILDFKPVMSIKTHIIFIKTIDIGVGVGYGQTFVAKRPTKLVTLPVGYADGYPRALSSKGRVLINGEYAPIVGRICMDQMMVDVTDIGEVHPEDEVTLMGEDKGKFISAEEIGDMSCSFNYEVVCGVSPRVPRVYYRDGKAVSFSSPLPTAADYYHFLHDPK